ncbi:glycoside hydrolase family 172 protein [Negadavirga shengliensis]|uniref:Glycoside hydrolase family 172 protein n=1 Tax=Negadavirga shengliensis TaxID=1389218 RepID=A0ABV9T1E4_9BACT
MKTTYKSYGRELLFMMSFVMIMASSSAQEWYKKPEGVNTRWTSFENPEGEKGAGGKENKGAKGHAYDQVNAGETVTLLDVEGAGIIHRIWLTINARNPEMLRSLRMDMYWDGEEKPAVSVPLGDFFGVGLGRRVKFENDLFSDPEGRSFNCFIPMPFKSGARIAITNESEKDLLLLFYDINFVKLDEAGEDLLYFHAYWNREPQGALGKDYEILPKVLGTGRFLGTNIGVITDPVYEDTWWGEGEVKMYLDGDRDLPTLIGTGTEDYIGSAWEQGTFANRFQGSLIVDKEKGLYTFYRYHIPDPVYFYEDIQVTIQRMGGAQKEKVIQLLEKGAELIPVTAGDAPNQISLLDQDPPLDIHDEDFPPGWTNFYRKDDWSSTAYFYLDKPVSHLPELQVVEKRTEKLQDTK